MQCSKDKAWTQPEKQKKRGLFGDVETLGDK